MSRTRKTVIRVAAVLGMLFSAAFCVTYKKTGYCLGDEILTALGLQTWSKGTEGVHYTVLIGLAMLLAAFGLFAATTKNRKETFRYLSCGVFGFLILAAIFSV